MQDNVAVQPAEFVHCGPGTLGGRYLRRYWHPVYVASRLATGQAVPIRILGEDFTLYRGQSGTPHVVAHRCAHRGTQLSTGWVEGDSIRCYFHGWRFEGSGQCVEQPGEVVPFCHKVKIATYPCEEYLGHIFAYFGEGPPPPLPRWPELECLTPESGTLEATAEIFPCNYFQHVENILDEVHLPFAHRGFVLNKPDIPRITAQETPFGLSAFVHHQDGTLKSEFIMPNQCFISILSPPFSGPNSLIEGEPAEVTRTLFWYVPVDDTHHMHVQVIAWPAAWASPEIAKVPASPPNDEVAAILAGRRHLREVEDHTQLGRIQDGISIVGQGAIADRKRERLGASDAAIIVLRKIWLRELRRLASGEPLTAFVRPDPQVLLDQEDALRRSSPY